MRDRILRIERAVLRSLIVQVPFNLIRLALFRLYWFWGRIRFGVLVRNRGLGCVCAPDNELKYPVNLTLGERVIIGTNVSIGAHSAITIGDDVRISRDVMIETAGLNFRSSQPPYEHTSKPIRIHSGVWIGARSIILGGVTIGENAVIAAGSVVSRSVKSGDIVAGVPARPVGHINEGSGVE